MFIFPDLGGATPNHRLAFPGEGKETHQKSSLLHTHTQPLLQEHHSCCCLWQRTFKLAFIRISFIHSANIYPAIYQILC